ncbi:MAG TPA: TIM barrel protein [Lapillicoccus sp.]|jgi:inosose dehydratase|nr:TIM barrel protein [Lapillicoccus sp.]
MSIRWAYALDQWKPQFDDFVRRRDHERALKTIAVAGFSGVQLSSGSGRWAPLGNPDQIVANFGSLPAFSDFVRACALDGVAAYSVDLGQAFHEDLRGGADPGAPADRETVLARATWFADALAAWECQTIVVRPAPSGAAGAADEAGIDAMADCWNAVGEVTAQRGVRTVLRFDFLSSLRLDDGWDRLLEAVDPRYVGVAIDTGELAAAGRDPLAELARGGPPVEHVVLSNALQADELNEFTRPGAEFSVRQSGGERRIGRWFGELEQPGLVDAEQFLRALDAVGYDGWVVVNTAPSPHPATSALLSGYHLHRTLDPLVRSSR